MTFVILEYALYNVGHKHGHQCVTIIANGLKLANVIFLNAVDRPLVHVESHAQKTWK